ncbi:hypothetical protein COV11_01350, partial [Candidatus Woesearchaeota archaeon CG10_big_fil_rev_8_21_14_0_10_30_7]
KDKIVLINKALQSLNKNIQQAIDIYFSHSQKNGKSGEHLARIFMNDCFFILDYFKFKNRILEKSAFQTNNQFQNASAELVFNVCKYVEEFMKNTGLRDYADQLIEVIKLFENKKESIPEFDYILIDEYQDVNSTQIKLIDLLSPKNIFCVGDPRQSIFGWRGSDIKYILNFEEKYSECEFITLTKNYRSTKHIVDLINTSIKSMKLPDLTSALEGEKNTYLFNFDAELAEFEFVIQRIQSLNLPRKEIFVLARTNKQLKELSQILKLRQIKHLIRTEETRKTVEPQDDEITLATIHSIKGLEAEVVFVIGCNNSNFPCKTSDHPVIDMIKVEEYDKEEEEKRLFYVGMSRAKTQLYLTHSGKKPTSFVTEEMLNLMKPNTSKLQPVKSKINIDFSNDAVTKLKEWRRKISVQQGMPAYIIMHDKTLIEIAQKLPENKTELEFINGMGPNKISKYGEEILEILHAN